MNFRRLLIASTSLLLIVSCGSQSRVVTTKKEQDKQQKDVKIVYVDKDEEPESQPQLETAPPPGVKSEPEVAVSTSSSTGSVNLVAKYIDLYKEVAKFEMKEHGIPASITLAQGILESGSGTSELAVNDNNHFGIKCTSQWQGEKTYQNGDCFRKYENVRFSFKDHSLFLQRPHYRSLFSLPKNDYKAWAKGLKTAGYATDRKYPEKLINIIERYQLYKYDREVLGASYSQETQTTSTASENQASVNTATAYTDDVTKYIELYKEVAKSEMKEHGIPASITLAQGILESGSGNSEVAVRAKNHFGIKCTGQWQGDKLYRDDECFRKYDNVRDSFKDHSMFLKRPHYRSLFSLPKNDYKAWAKGLKAAGYATDRKYPEKLINIIERYQLYQYDREVLGAAYSQETQTTSTASESQVSVNTATATDDVTKYIELYKAIAKSEMKEHGIPASITLAQGILESGSGNSEVAVRAKNHFGIKCTGQWLGDKLYRDDECFRKYDNARLSFRDHSMFLKRPHYRSLFSLPKNDYKAWAKGLKAAGYATDRKYPEKLINIIERYQLYKYDREVLGTAYSQGTQTTSTPPKTKDSVYYVVARGDTLYSISRKYGLTVKELMRMNGLKNTNISVGQSLKISGQQ